MTGLEDGSLETAAEMAAALRAGEVTSAELVERACKRAEAWQPVTNAFSQLWPHEAMAEACRVDALAVHERGPLTGVPIAVKDLYDVAGRETTGCCAAYRGRVAERDAPAIQALRGAGLVIIGKTNQHELAAGGTNLVSACGRTGNPWDPSRMTGGSSGGSGAAVAAGVVPWALGSDTGGSIRIPSSMCGTFGLKPTTGLLPLVGLLPLAPSLDCPGPMAGTLEDMRTLFEIMSGSDGAAGERRLRPPLFGEPGGPLGVEPLRVGVPDGFFTDLVHAETLAVVAEAAAALERARVEVRPVDGHGIEGARRLWMEVTCPEFADAHRGIDRSRVDPSVVAWMELGESLGPSEREDAARRRRSVAGWFVDRLSGVDALLVPTTPYPAPRFDERFVDLGPAGTVEVEKTGPGWMTCSVNLAGLPAVNLPAGRSAAGLPIGVSLIGAPRAEERLMALAARWVSAARFRPLRPALLESPGPE